MNSNVVVQIKPQQTCLLDLYMVYLINEFIRISLEVQVMLATFPLMRLKYKAKSLLLPISIADFN